MKATVPHLIYRKAKNIKGQEIDWIGTDTDQLIELAKEIIF